MSAQIACWLQNPQFAKQKKLGISSAIVHVCCLLLLSGFVI